jgi:hypothetical protein
VIPPSQAKDPVLVLIVALFLWGVAYFLIGQWQKGLVGVGAWFLVITITIATCGAGVLLYLPFQLAIAVDAYLQAQELKAGRSIGQWTFFSQHV